MKQNKADLISNINRDLADNATQEISPRDVRQNLLDIIDSTANFLTTEEIVSSNFATPASRTTIAGDYVLEKLGQESYTSEDNSAFGYAALRQNFQGSKNTAIGCFSLNCNVYGTDNVAVGYEAIAGNSNGIGNVGIGNYSLYYNKLGNMNVAIGHGAGYYADRESSQKLYIGVHPVTEQYVCDNPEGEGLTPLVHGDFELQRFGVNVNSFHPYGTVQVSGGISPSEDNKFELGHIDYAFSDVNTRSVSFWEGNSYTYDPESDTVVVSGVQSHADDIKPLVDNTFSLGSPSNNWRNINTYNLSVLGTATVNEYKAVTTCLYECKTLYLATSGVCDGETSPCGYLDGEELIGAGLIIPSSGEAGLSNHKWTIVPSGVTTQSYMPTNATDEDKAYWVSNNNVFLSGDYSQIRAMKHLGNYEGEAAFGGGIAGASNAFAGMNIVNDQTYQRVIFSTNDGWTTASDYTNLSRAGDGDFSTFLSRYTFSINDTDSESNPRSIDSRRLTISTQDNNVPVSLNLNHGTSHKRGVEFYSTSSGVAKGLYISTYDGTSSNEDINTVSIMEDDTTGGVFGVSDFGNMGLSKLPETIINARSKSDASIRVTAENAGDVTAALELCGNKNCLEDAAELAYHRGSGVATMSTYLDSGRLIHTTYNAVNGKTIFNNGDVVVGEGDASGVISILNHPEDTILTSVAGHTRLYSREVDMPDQSSELIYVDSDGNSWPLSLVTSQLDPVFWDSNLNLWGGSGTPYDVNNEDWVEGAVANNTVYGNFAFRDSTIGPAAVSVNNTVLGMAAGSGINIATDNIIIGTKCASDIRANINNNVLIGNNIGVDSQNFNNVIVGNNIINKSSNSILIGNEVLNGVTASGMSDQTFMLGNQDHVLMSGSMPYNYLCMPDGGEFAVKSSDNSMSTVINQNSISIMGSGVRYGEDPFVFNFIGEEGLSESVMTLDHSAFYPMNNAELYESSNPRRAFVRINGDARVRGAIRFADGTSLDSASTVQNFEEQLAAMQELIDTQTIEGIMLENVSSPEATSLPTIGVMSQLNGETATIVLRDQYLRLEEGDYVIANRIKNDLEQYEYRPVWVSNESSTCGCGRMMVEEEEDPLDGGNP